MFVHFHAQNYYVMLMTKENKTMGWEFLRLQIVQNFCQRLRVFMNIFNFFENCK